MVTSSTASMFGGWHVSGTNFSINVFTGSGPQPAPIINYQTGPSPSAVSVIPLQEEPKKKPKIRLTYKTESSSKE
jgi:hypothetical protein